MASEIEDVTAAREALGRQLRAWRERAGLTQQHLAHRTGYSRTREGSAGADGNNVSAIRVGVRGCRTNRCFRNGWKNAYGRCN